jgi:hypothetical protein
MQDGPGAAADANISRLEYFERHDGGVEQVPHFMSQEPCALISSGSLSIERRLILLAAELGDGTRDGVVKAPIEHAEVIRGDGRAHLHCELCDGLTDVSIVVHDLGHGEALKEQLMPC